MHDKLFVLSDWYLRELTTMMAASHAPAAPAIEIRYMRRRTLIRAIIFMTILVICCEVYFSICQHKRWPARCAAAAHDAFAPPRRFHYAVNYMIAADGAEATGAILPSVAECNLI